MRKFTSLFFGLVFLWSATSVFAVNFSKFKHVVVFGDSLSDNGNLFAITEAEGITPQPPFPPYGEAFDETGKLSNKTFPGRFTDGQNWVDYFPLVAQLPILITPFFLDPTNGTNVAVGGSTSANLLQSGPNNFPPAQVPEYLNIKSASSDDLYLIWIGADDFAAGITPRTTVTNIRNALAELAKAGAKDFIVVDAPDISLTPKVQALGSATIHQARQFVAAVNLLLALEIPLSASLDRINITLVDINALFVPLVLNPIYFGFSNSTTPALVALAANPNVNPNDYLFWDDFHPTTGAHLLAAKFIYHVASFKFSFSALSFR